MCQQVAAGVDGKSKKRVLRQARRTLFYCQTCFYSQSLIPCSPDTRNNGIGELANVAVLSHAEGNTCFILSKAQSSSSRVMTRGGAKRITLSWVSLARMPSSIRCSQ